MITTQNFGGIELIQKEENEYLISSRIMCQGLGLEHESLMRAIDKYRTQLESFGGLRFEIGTLQTRGGMQAIKTCYLNAQQTHLIASLSKNTEEVVSYKVALVRAFGEAQEIVQQLKIQQLEEQVTALSLPPVIVKDEAYFHNLILRYADYSTLKFRSEAILDNHLDSDDGCKSRRLDLIRVTPRSIQVYELKAHTITEDDISRTLALKGYLSLVAKQFPNKPIDFRFTSPYGISDSGTRLLEMLNSNKGKYTNGELDGVQCRYKLSFDPLTELGKRIEKSTLRVTPSNLKYWLEQYVNPDFEELLPKVEKKVVPFIRPTPKSIAA